jgi:hypothetical protein
MATPIRVRICAGVVIAMALNAATSALAQDLKRPDLKEEGKKLFDKNKGGSGKAAAAGGGWAVAVFTFRGDQRAAESRKVLEYVRSTGQLPEARMEERGPSVVILVGSFDDPQSQEAKSELERIRKITVAGSSGEPGAKPVQTHPYGSAFLAPPTSAAGEGNRPEINLLRVREQHPEAVYSFQVAVYGRDDIKERKPTEDELRESRRSAEQAALELRSEGEEAYYFHGPSKSMVTIGTFDLTDYDPQMPQFESERLKAVRKRHPLNLYNGAAIKVTTPGKPAYLQPSQLVDLPKK